MSLDAELMLLPHGWGFEIRSYEDDAYTVELYRFDKMPFGETGFIPIRTVDVNLAAAFKRAREQIKSQTV